MPRSFDSTTLALLDSGSLVQRDLLLVSLPEGDFGFWNDVCDVQFPSQFPGVTFTGSASLIKITAPVQTVSLSAQSLTGTLSGLATDVLATLRAYNLHRATVTIARALYDPSTRILVNVWTVFRGLIDRDEIREADGESNLVIEFASRAREMDRSSNRRRDFADQSRDFPGDRGFEFLAKTGTQPIKWGSGQSSGAKRAGG